LVSDEVHMRQLSATPSSAFSLQQRRQSNSVTHSAPPDLPQGVVDTKEEAPPGGGAPGQEGVMDPDERVVLRRAVDRGAIALAQIDDLKLEGDDDDDEDEVDGLGLSNPAAQTTDDEQITVKGAGTETETAATSSTETAAASCEVS